MSANLRKIIAIDCGKMNLKATDGKKEVIYTNKFSNNYESEAILGKNTFNVCYENFKYTIGNGATKHERKEGKDSDFHIISALTAVTKFITPTDASVRLIYGESIDMYYNKDHKNNLKSKLLGKQKIVVNEIEYEFNIESVLILPEGVGHVLCDMSKYSGIQHVVDIGGGTINFLSVSDGSPKKEESFSVPMGIHNLVTKIKTECKRKKLGTINDETLSSFLTKGSPNEKIQKVIDDVAKEHFNQFNDEVASHGVDIENLFTLSFTGGGSETLKEIVQKIYPNASIVSDCLLANVKGFCMYGKSKYNSWECEISD